MFSFFQAAAVGKYGIESLKKAILAAIALYDLFAAVYLDDKEFKQDDLIDLISLGPPAVSKVIAAAAVAKNYGDEIADLSDAEQSELVALAGTRVQNPAFLKILEGVLKITDGIAELSNPDNPKN